MQQIDEPIEALINTLPQIGKLEVITVRPNRREDPVVREKVEGTVEGGLEGDHFNSQKTKRQVTLIQQEHLNAVAGMLGKDEVDPRLTRRNLVVSGINLFALRNRKFQIGSLVLEGTGYCHPCSRMEENLGEGGYNAMRGHGGITARILESGTIETGDEVKLIQDE